MMPSAAAGLKSYASGGSWPPTPQAFIGPNALAIDASGNVYAADTSNHRIRKFSSAGVLLASWGTYGTGNGQFREPRAIAVDASGTVVYVADTLNHRVQKFTVSGVHQATWGSYGTANGQFDTPQGIAVDGSGNVYVSEVYNHRVQKLTSSGTHVATWGSYGPFDDQFSSPKGLAVDAGGYLYVVDAGNRRVVKRNASTGAVVTTWGPYETPDGTTSIYRNPSGIALDGSGNAYVADPGDNHIHKTTNTGTGHVEWGKWDTADPPNPIPGSGNGEFRYCAGIATDPSNNVWVADTGNDRIQKLTSAGAWVSTWKANGPSDAQLDTPRGVAVDAAGNTYVADTNNHRIMKYSAAGSLVTAWGTAGSGNGQFRAPRAVVLDAAGNVYVVDTGNDRVQKFTPSGGYLDKFGSSGGGNGQFSGPRGIAIDATGDIFVTDAGNNRVQRFSSAHSYETQWGSAGSGNSQFNTPSGIAVDASGYVYVVDTNNHRVQKFDTAGAYQSQWGSLGTADGKFVEPSGIATTPAGTVVVADTGNERLQEFDPAGTLVGKFGSLGSADGYVYKPSGVAAGAGGAIYETELGNHRVQKWVADVTPPTTTATVNPSGWTKVATVTVSMSATDTQSPVTATYYRVGAGALATYTAPVPVTAEGVTTVDYWSIDAAGNAEATKTAEARIDRTAPVTGSNIDGAWHKPTYPVQLTPVDPLSGAAWTRYRVGSGASATYTAPFTVPSEGTTQVAFWSGDAAGNVETTKTATLKIDGTAPVTTSNITDTWHNASVLVTLSAGDALSGVGATYYRVGGGPQTLYAGAFPVTAEGVTSVVFWSVDAAGNVEEFKTGNVRIDKTPPSTTSDEDALWHAQSYRLHLSAVDGLSGVGATFYRIDGGATTTYTAPIGFATDGTHTVSFWSRDQAGNAEATKTATVKSDVSSPLTTSNIDGLWKTSPVTVSLVASAYPSGIKATYYRLNGGAAATYTAPFVVSTQGSTLVEWWTVDVAGNVEATRSGNVKVDTGAPTTTSNADSAWHTTPFNLVLTPSDAVSGVGVTRYRVDGSAVTTYDAPVSIATDGAHLVAFWSVDVAGNVESTKTATVKVDLAPPSTTSNIDGAWRKTPLAVTLTATDTASGVAGTRYRVNGGAAATYTAPFAVSAQGTTLVEWWSIDNVGRVETTKSANVRIDGGSPSTSSTIDTAWHDSTVTVSLTASDAVSGVASTYYRVGGGGVTTYSAPFDVGAEGQTTVEYWSVDNASNRETTRTGTVRIDRFAPSTTSNLDGGWRTAAFRTTLAPTDGGSGVAATYYRVNGGATSTYTAPFALPNGLNIVEYWSVDQVGRVETTRTGSVRIDSAAPVTTSNMSGLWWRYEPFTVILGSSDDTSGVAATYYKVNGGATTTYTAPFVVSTEGTNTVQFWSVDVAGNVETTRTGVTKVDLTPPTTTSNIDGEWRPGPFTLEISATDAMAGVSGTHYRVGDDGGYVDYTGPVEIGGTGEINVWYWSDDWAGNEETPNLAVLRLQPSELPVTSSNITGSWRNTTMTVSLTATSSVSTIRDTFYRVSAGATTTYTAPFQVGVEGETQVRFWSVDVEDRAEPTKTATVRIDRTPPSTTSNIDDAIHPAPFMVSLGASDALSGVAATRYRVAGGVAATYTAPFPVSTPGDSLVEFWSVDAAGNLETTRSATVRIEEGGGTTYTEIAGSDRFSTAVEISKAAFPSAGTVGTVVIATGLNWPDALGGAALAGAYDGPILLVHKDYVPSSVATEIGRLGATRAIIVGGTPAVSNTVRDQLLGLMPPSSEVTRVSGTDRFATAREIASATVEALGPSYDGTAFVATGLNFPDALAASPLAAARGWPIYLAGTAGLSTKTLDAMKAAGVTDAAILGSTGAVSGAVEGQLAAAPYGIASQRLFGGGRYQTAVEVATFGVTSAGLGWDKLALATGENFPDALAGGVLQGRDGSVLLLTPGKKLDSTVAATLEAEKSGIGEVRYLGSVSALSQTVRDSVAAILD